jgi:RNA polymerase sigma factor (sigma-70 family)
VKAPQLASVWRSVSLGVSITLPDAELLRRYQIDKTDEDFAALVQRYGRLVWMVCRNLTRCEADADDAFQAVFLVFLRNAHKLRDAGKLPAWLHGVAYRVCSKARLAAQRRTTRETKRAKVEGVVPVPDSRWDEALAAVQEEVARLPENLRVPFVVCCLEGQGVVEAAKMLGWKLGTLSGRLTRAKDRLLAKLEARGVVMSLAGFVAGLALVNAPAASLTKAMLFSTVGAVVPATILQLTSGVIGMGNAKLKLLLAGLFVAGGLGLGAGSGWINTAEAQQGGAPAKEKLDKKKDLDTLAEQLKAIDAKKQLLQLEMEAKNKALVDQAKAAKLQAEDEKKLVLDATKHAEELVLSLDGRLGADVHHPKWQYDIVAWKKMNKQDFVKYLYAREKDGWEYVGTNDFTDGTNTFVCWVFRKTTKDKLATWVDVTNPTKDTLTLQGKVTNKDGVHRVEVTPVPESKETRTLTVRPTALDELRTLEVRPTLMDPLTNKSSVGPSTPAKVDSEVTQLRAKIEELTAQLKKMESADRNDVIVFRPKETSPELLTDAFELLNTLGPKKFPGAFHVEFDKQKALFVLTGKPAAIKWATGMLDKLVGQRPAK